jgi:hypothetical protein
MPKLPTITIFGNEYRVPLLTLDAMQDYTRAREALVAANGPSATAKALLGMLAVQMEAEGLPFLTAEEIEAAPRRLTPGDMAALDRFMAWWVRESFGPGESIATSVSMETGSASSPSLPTTVSATAIPSALAA